VHSLCALTDCPTPIIRPKGHIQRHGSTELRSLFLIVVTGFETFFFAVIARRGSSRLALALGRKLLQGVFLSGLFCGKFVLVFVVELLFFLVVILFLLSILLTIAGGCRGCLLLLLGRSCVERWVSWLTSKKENRNIANANSRRRQAFALEDELEGSKYLPAAGFSPSSSSSPASSSSNSSSSSSSSSTSSSSSPEL
jgi:hypothetical protein